MKINTLILLIGILLIGTACNNDKDCEIIEADWRSFYLHNDGMAPEDVKLEAISQAADIYTWRVDTETSSAVRDTFTFTQSGDYDVSLNTDEGEHSCQQAGTITIKDYPYLKSDRAFSFFESDGSNVQLVVKVIDNPNAQKHITIPYSAGLPETGGGMDYDNAQKKLFAAPSNSLTSCFPNGADRRHPIPVDSFSTQLFFDIALDPNDDIAYISGHENGQLFIRSTPTYNGDGSTLDIHTEADDSDFIYLTTDRANDVIYWTKIAGDTIYKIERDSSVKVFLTDGPFYDLDFDNNKGLLFFAKGQSTDFEIRNIDPETGQQKIEAGDVNGRVSFIFVDEEQQEIFWVNNTRREIWKKRISFQMSSSDLLFEDIGKVRGIAVGNFKVD